MNTSDVSNVANAASVVDANVGAAGAAATVAASPAPKRAGRPRAADSNMTKARAIFQSFSDPAANARDIKARFVAELVGKDSAPMSKQTANTYFYLLSKEQR